GWVVVRRLEDMGEGGGAEAEEDLDEIGTRNGKERHVGFARDGAREQRLAGPRRADQQHPARDAPAEPLEFSRVAQELDDLLQVLLGLVDAGHVLEGDAAVGFGQELGATLAEAERLAARLLNLAREENPHPDERDEGKPRD